MKLRGRKAISGAAHAFNLLRLAMGSDWRPKDISVSRPDESEAEVYLGVNLPLKTLYEVRRLFSKNAKLKDVVGWLGYDKLPGDANREQQPSVYVYCETKDGAMWVERYMKGNNKAGYKTQILVDGATFDVRIWTNREHLNDLEWFQKTIIRLKNVPC